MVTLPGVMPMGVAAEELVELLPPLRVTAIAPPAAAPPIMAINAIHFPLLV